MSYKPRKLKETFCENLRVFLSRNYKNSCADIVSFCVLYTKRIIDEFLNEISNFTPPSSAVHNGTSG